MTNLDEQSIISAEPAHPDMRWYVVHAYSGMEKAVERNITERINREACNQNLDVFWFPLKKW